MAEVPQMLVAYIKSEHFEIKDIAREDTGVAVLPIQLYAEALAILGRAVHDAPDVVWEIIGSGPYGVFEKAAKRRASRR
jgi:hypothetical protein